MLKFLIIVSVKRKVCVLADSCFRGITLDGINVVVQPPQNGFEMVARLLRRKVLDISGIDLVHCSMGRADLECSGLKSFDKVLDDFCSTIRRFNSSCEIILAGPIPRGSDTYRWVGACVMAGKATRKFCLGRTDIKFSSLAMGFYDKAGIKQEFLNHNGASPLGKLLLKKDVWKFL